MYEDTPHIHAGYLLKKHAYFVSINLVCHLSSAVEQRFCKAWVLGSNPRGGSGFERGRGLGKREFPQRGSFETEWFQGVRRTTFNLREVALDLNGEGSDGNFKLRSNIFYCSLKNNANARFTCIGGTQNMPM